MALQRSGTRFGLLLLRKATPRSDNQLINPKSSGLVFNNNSVNKLKKKSFVSHNSKLLLKTQQITQDRSKEDARTGLKKLYMSQVVKSRLKAVNYLSIKHRSL
jgi:hypothetical protein